MPYSSINEVPKQLKSAGLSLKQANDWARYYDNAKNENAKSPAAVAWKIFKQKYQQKGNQWIVRKSYQGEDDDNKLKGYTLSYIDNLIATSLEGIDAEGKMYEKELIREGEWAHPQRPHIRLKVTLKRMQQWVNNFKKNLTKVFVPKRHSLDPDDNRGWLKDVYIKKVDGINKLYGKLDITNANMQKHIDNGDIQDVSISVGDYTDNQGIKHGETLQHVALTVIPHIDGQEGFTPINAEGYLCLEEVNSMDKHEVDHEGREISSINAQAPRGSNEQTKETLRKEIVNRRIFSVPEEFVIEGTYPEYVIVQYFGTGEGKDGEPKSDRYFRLPYAKNVDGNYEFGNKVELVKEFYFVEKVDTDSMLEDGYTLDTPERTEAMIKYFSDDKNREKYSLEDMEIVDKKIDEAMKNFKIGKYAEAENQKEEVKDMDMEKIQLENEQLKQEKADLEAKVAELEQQKSDVEQQIADKDAKLKEYEEEKQADFEKAVDSKIDSFLKAGKITQPDVEEVKGVLLEGGKAADVLEKVLSEKEAKVDLEEKTKTDSSKPKNSKELADEEAKAEAERINQVK